MNMRNTYVPSAENVKYLGRTYYSGDRLFCALSGSGAEFSFTGTQCSITISGDDNSAKQTMADSHARIAVYVNGIRVIDDMINQDVKNYMVFENETAKDVTVSIIKLSESPMSTISIDGITVTGTAIKPTKNKDLYIEFIGDSITCGYGIDDPVAENHFFTKTEDVTKAYAYKTAQALCADYSMVSFSGYGIISGYTTTDEKLTTQLVPPLYTKLGYSWSPNKLFCPSAVEWDFSKRQPDIIVVNLGTNDDSYTQNESERQEEYATAYAQFLKIIRSNNPNATILCTLGIMGDRLFDSLASAVSRYREETGDANIHTMKFDVQSETDGYSADFHPSVTTHDKAARKLTSEIVRLQNC